jgi:hypothetical protein
MCCLFMFLMFCGQLGFLLVVLLLQTSNFGIKLVFNLLGVGIEIFPHALPIGMSNRYMFLSWIRHLHMQMLQIFARYLHRISHQKSPPPP